MTTQTEKPATHTPGPWTALECYETPNGRPWTINADAKTPVASIGGSSISLGRDVCEANARLIAAAPTLLAACRLAMDILESDADDAARSRVGDQLEAAIAAATPEQTT